MVDRRWYGLQLEEHQSPKHDAMLYREVCYRELYRVCDPVSPLMTGYSKREMYGI